MSHIHSEASRDSSVVVGTGYGLNRQSPIPGSAKRILPPPVSRPALEPLNLLRSSFPGVKTARA